MIVLAPTEMSLQEETLCAFVIAVYVTFERLRVFLYSSVNQILDCQGCEWVQTYVDRTDDLRMVNTENENKMTSPRKTSYKYQETSLQGKTAKHRTKTVHKTQPNQPKKPLSLQEKEYVVG